MDFNDAQCDMRYAYFGGGPGVLASGLVWLIAGLVALVASTQASIFAIFLGGIFIHPLGMLLARLFKRPGKHKSGNPLGILALETTFILFIGLFLAFSVAQLRPEWFFPVMLLVIGGRYLTFSTIYGLRIYWILGALLGIAGGMALILEAPVQVVALAGGTIEIIFSAIIINLVKNMNAANDALPTV